MNYYIVDGGGVLAVMVVMVVELTKVQIIHLPLLDHQHLCMFTTDDPIKLQTTTTTQCQCGVKPKQDKAGQNIKGIVGGKEATVRC